MSDRRFAVIQHLKSTLRGVELAALARTHGVTIAKSGKVNKGWVGQLMDKVAKTPGINDQGKDGIDFELKSISVVRDGNVLVPAQTMAITMFNPEGILSERFRTSHLWEKLERLIVVSVEHVKKGPNEFEAYVRGIYPINIADRGLEKEVEDVWMSVRDDVVRGKIADYSSAGTSKNFVQLRTKGSGKNRSVCPVTGKRFNTRAFYATKELLRYVLGTL